jgi:hypothetical protein
MGNEGGTRKRTFLYIKAKRLILWIFVVIVCDVVDHWVDAGDVPTAAIL